MRIIEEGFELSAAHVNKVAYMRSLETWSP